MASINLDEEKEAVPATEQNTLKICSLKTGALASISSIKENTRKFFKGMGSVSAFLPDIPASSVAKDLPVVEKIPTAAETKHCDAKVISTGEEPDSELKKTLFLLNLGYKIIQPIDKLFEAAICSLRKFYESLTELASNIIKRVKDFFENKEKKPATTIHWSETLPFKKMYDFFTRPAETKAEIQPGSTNQSSEIEYSYNRKLKGLVEDIVSAAVSKDEKEKASIQTEIEIRQKKLSEQADRAFAQAIQMRPDLASRLQRPQVAFLASSPFAEAPSASDLIEQAEKAQNIH